MGSHCHSTYFNIAQNISVLVNKSLPFKLLDVALDPDDGYVHTHILSQTWSVVGLYLPPLASLVLLNKITSKLVDFAADHLILLDDFNMAPDPSLDWIATTASHYLGLETWAETYGLTDVWR